MLEELDELDDIKTCNRLKSPISDLLPFDQDLKELEPLHNDNV